MGKPLLRLAIAAGLLLVVAAGLDTPAGAAPGHPSAHEDGVEVATSTMPATAEGIGKRVEDVGREQQRVQRRLEELSQESRAVHALAVARGRAYVRMARAGLLPLSGGFSELVEHATHLERTRRALTRDLAREQALAKERLALADRLRVLGERKALFQDERAALERSHAAIAAAEERERAFRQAFMGESPDHTAVYSADGVAAATAGFDGPTSFASLRGRLPFPLAGRAEVRRPSGPGTTDLGVEMGSAAGAAVRAVYAGRIAFADEYGDFGRTVIVEHGGGYYTLSAGLAVLSVSVGEPVAAGDTLGTLGADGLYFEVRKGGDVADARAFLGI